MFAGGVSPTAVAILIFFFTYVLISGWRIPRIGLNRPSGALAGAVLMVVCGVLTPGQAYATLNHDTMALLLGTMILSEFLKHCGFYAAIAERIGRARLTPFQLLGTVAGTAAVLSAFLVNDTVCFMLTPLVVTMVNAARLPLLPFLMALATSANIGSALTLTGNPQNMLVGTMSQIAYLRFMALSALPVCVAFIINFVLLGFFYGRELRAAHGEPATPVEARIDRALFIKSLFCLALSIAGFALEKVTGINMAWTSMAAATLLLAIGRVDPYKIFAGVDWTLLLFFAGLFVVIGGLEHTGLLADLQQKHVAPLLGESTPRQALNLSWISIAGSQIFSNVPYVLVTGRWIGRLANPEFSWVLLAYISTIAGNLTILGSVANVIVIEQAREHIHVGFLQYLKFGALTTLATAASGLAILLLQWKLGFFAG